MRGFRGSSPGLAAPPGLAESMRRHREDPQPLAAAVGGLLSARGWRQQAAMGAVFGNWPEIVGREVAAHTRPESFDDGELTVTADSDAWATQVRYLAPKVLARLAEELGAGTVRHIRVHGPSRRKRPRAPHDQGRHVTLRRPQKSVTKGKIERSHADKDCRWLRLREAARPTARDGPG